MPYLDLPDIDAPQPASGEMLWGDGAEIDALINVRAAALGLRVAEVVSVEAARLHGVSTLRAFREGKLALRAILEERRLAQARRKANFSIPPKPDGLPTPRPTDARTAPGRFGQEN